jgi:Organic radical activating enzymes
MSKEKMPDLPVSEIFSSIQGEGPYVGVRQIFLRLPKCNLTCPYCDTETKVPESLRLEIMPGSRNFKKIENPVPLSQLLELMRSYDFSLHHSVSVTGGEPLLWTRELQVLLPLIKESNLKVYLETNGTMPNQLLEVLPMIDIISMDIKLPFSGRSFWDEHESFLRHSLKKEVFVKIVVNENTPLNDLESARDLIARVSPDVMTILQPVTKTRGINTPQQFQLLEWQSLFLKKLNNVRVIPQTHVMMGQL